MVSTLLGDPLLEQEGPAGGENHVFTSGGLLPGIRRYVGQLVGSFSISFVDFNRPQRG